MALREDSRLIGWFMVVVIILVMGMAIWFDPQEVALFGLNPIQAILGIPTAIGVGISNIITDVSNAIASGAASVISAGFNMLTNWIYNAPSAIYNAFDAVYKWLTSLVP